MVNYYCDESCHLAHDGQPVMVLGALRCPEPARNEVAQHLRDLKARHGLSPAFEAKWSKVSPGKAAYYAELLEYFASESALSFRAVVASREGLDHDRYEQDHDTWYYKMYFQLLREMLQPTEVSRIFIDIKDTQGANRVAKLSEILSADLHGTLHEALPRIQQVRSHEVEHMQLVDLLVGVVSAANRVPGGSPAKQELIDRSRQLFHCELTRSTPRSARKVNIFAWRAQSIGSVGNR